MIAKGPTQTRSGRDRVSCPREAVTVRSLVRYFGGQRQVGKDRAGILPLRSRAMNHRANNPAFLGRACAGRRLAAGTLALLLSPAIPPPAVAHPDSAHLARVTPGAAPQVSVRAAQNRKTCMDASGDAAIKACSDA